jgi:hypothetical protein
MTVLRCYELPCPLAGAMAMLRTPLGLIVGVPFVSNQPNIFAVYIHLAGTFVLSLLHVFGLGGIDIHFLPLTLLFSFSVSPLLPISVILL